MELPKTLGKFLWYFIKEQKWWFLTIQLASFAWSIDHVIWPYILKLIVDQIANYSGSKTEIFASLKWVMISGAIFWISLDAMYRLSGYMMAIAQPKLEASIRMKMFDYVQHHSHGYFADHFAGNISNKISDMATSASRVVGMTIFLFIPVVMAFFLASQVFLALDVYLSAVLIAWLIVHFSICFYTAKACDNYSLKRSESRSVLTGRVVDSLTNNMNVRMFARYSHELSFLRIFQRDERAKHTKTLIYQEHVRLALGIFSFFGTGVGIFWMTMHLWQIDRITLGDVVLVFNTAFNITTLAWIAGVELPNLYREIGTCRQAMTLIKDPHSIIDTKGATNLKAKHGRIEFKNVTFIYGEKHRVFNDKSIIIEAGQKVGLVGYSGAGKSTFVNLILRFFDIDAGEILIDGQNIAKVKQDSLHENISVIPQDSSLFHRSVMDNIRYGSLDATDKQVIAAAKKANAHEFIMDLYEGYQTSVGERGVKLSGGQRQRIAIARAALKNAPILILDEATSALDSVTEKQIQDSLKSIMKNKTAIVIAHRLSTLADMDRILVFDDGSVIEDGAHQSLLKKKGHYYKLWSMQADGFLPECDDE